MLYNPKPYGYVDTKLCLDLSIKPIQTNNYGK